MQEEKNEPIGLAAAMKQFADAKGEELLMQNCALWAETLSAFEIAPLLPVEREALNVLVKALHNGLDLVGIPR